MVIFRAAQNKYYKKWSLPAARVFVLIFFSQNPLPIEFEFRLFFPFILKTTECLGFYYFCWRINKIRFMFTLSFYNSGSVDRKEGLFWNCRE